VELRLLRMQGEHVRHARLSKGFFVPQTTRGLRERACSFGGLYRRRKRGVGHTIGGPEKITSPQIYINDAIRNKGLDPYSIGHVLKVTRTVQ